MKWTFTSSIKETDHKFLNFYIVNYEVEKDDGTKKDFSYFVASRNLEKQNLRVISQDFKERADAVLIGAYKIIDSKLYLLLEHQFRPALNHDVVSFPAGLCDKEDKDIIDSARRELQEETGYLADDYEAIVPPSPTSEGLSDECNAVVICRVKERGIDNKEEFEDILARLYSEEEVREMLKDKQIIFSNSARLLVLYLLERFGRR